MKNINSKILYPADAPEYFKEWGFSPAVSSGGFVFVSGCTGARQDGTVPDGIEDQTREAFRKIRMSLTEAELDFHDIVEMTTYHVGLKDHLQAFISVKSEFISDTFPAWTAVGVSELAADNAIVEIRIIAKLKDTQL